MPSLGQRKLRMALLVTVVLICGLYMGSNTPIAHVPSLVIKNLTRRIMAISLQPSPHYANWTDADLSSIYFKQDKPTATSMNSTETNTTQSPTVPPVKESNASKLCTFPVVDPFDPALESVLDKRPPLNCQTAAVPNVVRLENHDTLKVVPEAVQKAFRNGTRFKECVYRALKRDTRTKAKDQKAIVSATRGSFNDTFKVNSTDEEIRVDCFATNGTIISKSWFAFVRPVKADTQKVLDERLKTHLAMKRPVETLSILMLGTDGFAKQHFARTMPKARDFLINELGALEMNKHGKLAYQTFPNVLPLLTGRTSGEFGKDPKYKFKEGGTLNQINDAFIWSEAKRLGYRTGLMMDMVEITAFHALRRGYTTSPVDHYLRSIVCDSEKDTLMRSNTKNCMGDTAEIEKMYDYWFQLLTHYNSTRSTKTPFFAYSFLARLTHDDYNQAYKGDEIYLDTFKKLKNSNTLNNTVIVWFSDHGERFGRIRQTYQGTIESSTPYLFFIFPPWFERKYPEVMRTFKINQNRLTSHFDTWATLRDLLYFTGKPGPNGTVNERAISLFREIPEERTCRHAGIPAEYCVCARFSKATLSPDLDHYLGMVLSAKVQGIVKPHSAKCAELRLGSVESIYEEKSASSKEDIRTFRVTIMTEPGNALFEATLDFNKKTNKAAVVGEVARTNMYRGQSECMTTVKMRRYCYCKNVLPKTN